MIALRALLAKLRGRPIALCDVGDVDGLASAALFKKRHPEGVVILVGPSDVKKWWVRAFTWDFVADLPCPGKAKVRADHHVTRRSITTPMRRQPRSWPPRPWAWRTTR